MRYDHLDMLPEQAFKKLGKQMTYEGGGGGKKGKKPPRLQLKPVTTTTGFGSGYANPLTGQYGYNLDPRLAEMRDIFYGASKDFLPSEEQQAFAQDVTNQGMGLFGTGQDWLGQATAYDPRSAGQQYYSDIMKLQSADRATEEARLADTLFRTGRTGAAVSYDGGYLNPEQFALLKAREQANQGLAIQSEDLGRNRQQSLINQALGLSQSGLGQTQAGYGLGMLPYESAASIFGLGTGIEGLGMSSMEEALQAQGQQMAAQMALQQNAASRQKSGKGGKGGIGGLISAGAGLMSSNPLGGSSALPSIFGGGTSNNGISSWSPLTNYTPIGGPGVRLF